MDPHEKHIPEFRPDGYLPEGTRGGRTMIATATEYEKAQKELWSLEERLNRLQQSNPVGSKGFTKAGIRKMTARLHEESIFPRAGDDTFRPEWEWHAADRCRR